MVVAFIDDHRDRFGVEPICRVLTEHGVPIAPSRLLRRQDPAALGTGGPRRAGAGRDPPGVHDRELGRGLYGPGRCGAQLRREGGVDGPAVPRCQVERLMGAAGLHGVRAAARSSPPGPTRPRPARRTWSTVSSPPSRPNQLWVVDFTYVPTWSGTVFTAFVSDVFSRRIVGWRTAARMPTELPLDALEMALWTRARAGHDTAGVIHHCDAGSQYTAIRYANRLLDAGAVASIGTVGDSLLTG